MNFLNFVMKNLNDKKVRVIWNKRRNWHLGWWKLWNAKRLSYLIKENPCEYRRNFSYCTCIWYFYLCMNEKNKTYWNQNCYQICWGLLYGYVIYLFFWILIIWTIYMFRFGMIMLLSFIMNTMMILHVLSTTICDHFYNFIVIVIPRYVPSFYWNDSEAP